jgi:hypothetical protein
MSFVSFDNLAEKIKQDKPTAELYNFNKYSGVEVKSKEKKPLDDSKINSA